MPARPVERTKPETLAWLRKISGELATTTLKRLEDTLPWYRDMPPGRRSAVGLVAQAGISSFISWYDDPRSTPWIAADVFGAAPRELLRSVSLQQTLQLIKITVEVVEERVKSAGGEDLREAILLYSREIAFAAADVYARAAEARGLWDARLEALVVDELMRGDVLDDTVRSRAAALGWDSASGLVVVVGTTPKPLDNRDNVRQHTALVADAVHRAARRARLTVLTGVQSDRLVVIIGGAEDPLTATRALANEFGPGPLVIGPVVEDLLSAGISAQAALSAVRAAGAWPDAPRPVLAAELLPERALAGDEAAKAQLVAEVYRPLESAGAALLETVSAYLEQAASLESAARMLFVHPNTVRYRLKRVSDLTGLHPAEPRAAFTLHMALALGRLAGPANGL